MGYSYLGGLRFIIVTVKDSHPWPRNIKSRRGTAGLAVYDCGQECSASTARNGRPTPASTTFRMSWALSELRASLGQALPEMQEAMGGSLDREFSRRSPEAPIRSIHRIKGQQHGSKKKRKFAHVYQPEKIGGRHLYMYEPDPNTGRQILWQTDPARPCAVKEISQVILFDEHAEERQHIPIPTGIRTGREWWTCWRQKASPSPCRSACHSHVRR